MGFTKPPAFICDVFTTLKNTANVIGETISPSNLIHNTSTTHFFTKFNLQVTVLHNMTGSFLGHSVFESYQRLNKAMYMQPGRGNISFIMSHVCFPLRVLHRWRSRGRTSSGLDSWVLLSPAISPRPPEPLQRDAVTGNSTAGLQKKQARHAETHKLQP